MGNCLSENRPQSRPQRQHNSGIQHPYPSSTQRHQIPNHNPAPRNASQIEISLQEIPDLLQIPSMKKTLKKYQHHQLHLDPVALVKKYQGGCSQNFGNLVFLKVPNNIQEISYQTISQPLWIFPIQISFLSVQQMKGAYFQQKMTWFRIQVERLRVGWHQGCQNIKVDRHNVLMSSNNQLQKINLKKQVKIKFDQEEVDDAGGVLREWLHVAIKEIFNFQVTGLLRLCDNDQRCYRFVLDVDQSEDQRDFRLMIARLLGIIIGKALFQRISLNCFLTKSIWRQICGKSITLGDFYFYDKAIYSNLKMLSQNTCDTELGLFFNYTVSLDNDSTKLINLKPKGDQIPVTDSNKQQFIQIIIDYFCTTSCGHYIQAVKQGINKVFPCVYLQIFQPQELEMMINGPQFIDVRQWKTSTLYRNCSPKETQVQWFWTYVEKLDQTKLGNLLHYITGSRRVPILGFFYLQSNRNQINRFTIQRVAYDYHNPYPKSHTCFNRLELPAYKTEAELNQRMNQILNEEINSFGLS